MALRLFVGLKNLKIFWNGSPLVRTISNIKYDDIVINTTKSPRKKPEKGSQLPFGEIMSDHMLVVNWTAKCGWSAPKINPYDFIPMHPSSSVLHYGLACFEGMKAYKSANGNIYMFRPNENMNRFHRSSTRLSMPGFDKDELLKCIAELVRVDQSWIPDAENSSLYIRPTMISTESTLGVRPPASAMLFVITGPVGPYFSTGIFKPISLLADPSFIRSWPGGIGDIKAGGNYAPTIYPQRIAESKGCAQCLWLYNDEVTEVGTMNIFMHWINEQGEEELITPALNGLILPGVTRKSLLELAREWNEFKVSEKSFTIQQMIKAANEGRIKEVLGAGTACVVLPIEKILYNNEFVRVDTPNGFPLSQRLFKELTDIQYGRKSHHWSYLVSSH
ncbi:branched-chain-amino-acid aminotransferase, cytosolic isoform X3 [Hydra vulgaris]|uniref:branched-chain-amino-acid aminotransferase, cytosolic isoform X3 n=1 Tax=Hydra vulgaris TaxID=6087 RepID=UPI001F5F521D|nr:branched-chain-amino-acid aminotransferase, cytosolic-like [Hydra vulgaris]